MVLKLHWNWRVASTRRTWSSSITRARSQSTRMPKRLCKSSQKFVWKCRSTLYESRSKFKNDLPFVSCSGTSCGRSILFKSWHLRRYCWAKVELEYVEYIDNPYWKSQCPTGATWESSPVHRNDYCQKAPCQQSQEGRERMGKRSMSMWAWNIPAILSPHQFSAIHGDGFAVDPLVSLTKTYKDTIEDSKYICLIWSKLAVLFCFPMFSHCHRYNTHFGPPDFIARPTSWKISRS